jgi:hypothetical protein
MNKDFRKEKREMAAAIIEIFERLLDWWLKG